jgi:hypothetical protein
MKLIKQLIFTLIIGTALLSLNGCSAIGFGIGAISDSNKIEKMEIPMEQIPLLPRNSNIHLALKDGQQLEGIFLNRMEQKVGDDNSATMLLFDKVNNRQIATHIGDIEHIEAMEKQNRKWLGLLIGGIIDAILIVVFLKMDTLFEGLSFFNYP